MSECHCHICLSNYAVSAFRALKCGHCYCLSCITSVQRTNTKPVCPDCRAPILANGPQPIYLDVVGAKPLARLVAEGIERMDGDAKLVSVHTAQRKLQQVAREMEEREEATAQLLTALADFSDRIAPLFSKARSQATEIRALRTQLADAEALRAQAERATALAGEVAILRAEQRALRDEVRDAHASRELERTRAEAGEGAARRAEAAQGEAQREVRKLKGYLERAAEDRNVQKQKMKAVMREKDALEQQLKQQRKSAMQMQMRKDAMHSDNDDLEVEEEPKWTYLEGSSESESEPSLPQRASGSRPAPVLTFEGMPRPGFASDWQLQLSTGTGRGMKRKAPDGGFPIALNQGRAAAAVQLGPKHSRRVKVR
ncbi:hypothetical protein DFH08DRAFT_388890 [Mycena albidolilacea]|uniref:RING-type domain-containing protein n=1 Tax=Mycena albidolilacea TaxID=1033008 RepID=A0AAD6ZGK0_9AGAR|nr:hypothetical protein DFH08DRAFT_388890 [Mycena albidolilacea]